MYYIRVVWHYTRSSSTYSTGVYIFYALYCAVIILLFLSSGREKQKQQRAPLSARRGRKRENIPLRLIIVGVCFPPWRKERFLFILFYFNLSRYKFQMVFFICVVFCLCLLFFFFCCVIIRGVGGKVPILLQKSPSFSKNQEERKRIEEVSQ